MCPLLMAPSTASSSCLTPSPYLSGPFSFRQQMLPLCRMSRSTSFSPSHEFSLHPKCCLLVSDQINNQPILPIRQATSMTIQTGVRLNSQQFVGLAQSLLASPEIADRAALLADAIRQ